MISALVSGASRGIGYALTEHLLADGHRVAAISRSGQAPLGALNLTADVRDISSVRAAVAHADEQCPLNLAVANAGVLGPTGRSWELSAEQWWETFEINVFGAFAVVRACLEPMVTRGSGTVIVVSSGIGNAPAGWMSAYGASKSAVTHLVSSLAVELAGTGVSIFAISPGMVKTDMTVWPEDLTAFRPDLHDQPDSAFWDVAHALDLVTDLATGRFAGLSGEFIHVRDDREALLARVLGSARIGP